MSVSALTSSSSTQLVQTLFEKTDTDSSGGISLTELLSSSSSSSVDSSQVAALFSTIDRSSDGQISQSELQTAFDCMSSDMQSTLLNVQESANSDTSSSASLPDVLNSYAAVAKGNNAPPPSPLSEGGGDSVGSGGGGGGAGGPGGAGGAGGGGGAKSVLDSTESSSDTSTDPADTNGDGIVTAAEQAAYDAKHSAEVVTKAASSGSTTAVTQLAA